MMDTVILDVDGTLIDSNYHHTLAWCRAFRRYDITVPVWTIHRAIGMGGDQLISHVAGDKVETEHGEDLRAAWTDEYEPFLEEVQPFEGAQELLEELRRRGVKVVLASSGQADQVDHYLGLINGKELADAWTTADDVETTKPAPDLVQVALRRVGGSHAVMIGDTPWDAVAARKVGVPTYALLTGGYSTEELTTAGVRRVYETLPELRDDLDRILTGA